MKIRKTLLDNHVLTTVQFYAEKFETFSDFFKSIDKQKISESKELKDYFNYLVSCIQVELRY